MAPELQQWAGEESLAESPTWFRQALLQWHYKDLTAHYGAFFSEVTALCKSLPELLHHRHRIFEALLRHLVVPHSHCLQALLEVAAALARDLRRYAHEYMPRLLPALAGLVGTRDPNLPQWVFSFTRF